MTFVLGVNSSLDPASLPKTAASRAMNMLNRGGIFQCRPGYRCLMALPEGHLQGFGVFRPKIGRETLLFGVAGRLYVSEYPFKEYRQLAGIEFSETARQLYFQMVEQSIAQNPDGSLTFIDPKSYLVIQDGGSAPAVLFDGTTAVAQRGEGSIPLGGPMRWVGDRLWVARGPLLFASDLADPTSFTETNYITGATAFVFSSEITALAEVPTVNLPVLFVFTRDNTSTIQAGLRDRASWAITPDFQKVVIPKIGAVSQRSVISHYGRLFWFDKHGLTSYDAAAQAQVSSALPYLDEEMADSKGNLSTDLTGVACATFENYLMVSVPYCDRLNRHTWVLDNSIIKFLPQQPPAWNGFWTGTRPVEWQSGQFNGESRVLYISTDYDGMNRLWEAWTPDRRDDGCPITWWLETRAVSETPGKLHEFRYAELFLTELSGDVDVAVFWAGSSRGKFKKILTKRIRASRGTFRSGQKIKMTDKIFALKKQSRLVRTQDGKALTTGETLSSCDVEAPHEEFIDDAFQLLIVGSGPGAVKGFITYSEPPKNLDNAGGCEEDETEENFVRFDGAAAEDPGFDEALQAFDENIPLYVSNRTATVTQNGVTEIAVGEATSVISQADADKVALCVATRKAANRLESVLPQIVSLGATANE